MLGPRRMWTVLAGSASMCPTEFRRIRAMCVSQPGWTMPRPLRYREHGSAARAKLSRCRSTWRSSKGPVDDILRGNGSGSRTGVHVRHPDECRARQYLDLSQDDDLGTA